MKLSKTTLWILWALSWAAAITSIKLFLSDAISALWLIVTLIFGLIVMGLFIYDVVKNKNLNQNKKMLWIIFFLIFFSIASPLYLIFDRPKN